MSRKVLGFDQKIQIAWLDHAASKVLAGCSSADVQDHLYDLLDGVVGGRREYSARSKTVTVLTRIWSKVPTAATGLKGRALALLPDANAPHRLAIHWAMATGSYVFFNDASTIVGRMVDLQGNVAKGQLARRMQETWGDRSTLLRASQVALRNMVRWGVLKDAEERGVCVTSGGNSRLLSSSTASCSVPLPLPRS